MLPKNFILKISKYKAIPKLKIVLPALVARCSRT